MFELGEKRESGVLMSDIKNSSAKKMKKTSKGDIKKLIKALKFGDEKEAIELMDLFDDLDEDIGRGDTILMFASFYGRIESVKRLIELKVSINLVNNVGATALMSACSLGHLEVIKLLISSGADVNIVSNNCEDSAFSNACESGSVESVKYLIESGVDIKKCGGSSLIKSVKNKHLEINRILINDCKVDVNYLDSIGNSSLHFACCNKHLSVIEQLIDYDIDVFIKNREFQTAMDVAHKDVREFTLNYINTKHLR